MTSSSRQWFTRLAVAVALWPASAEAQTMARSFDELRGLVNAEETVIVTDMKGRRIKGRLTAVGQDSLSVSTNNHTQMLARSEVSTLRVIDSLGNGALIGAGAGLGAALGILAIVGGHARSGDGYVLPSAKVAAPLMLSGAGALVGVLIDRAHTRVLYVSPGQTSGLVVAPLLGKDRQGVLVSVRF